MRNLTAYQCIFTVLLILNTWNASFAVASTIYAEPVSYHASKRSKAKPMPYFYGCFFSSSQKYRIPADLLIAIAQTESSMNPRAYNNNGSTQDHGLMQINSSWLPKISRNFGITKEALYEPCTSIEVGAWILTHNFVENGYSWNAVGAYNVGNIKTSNKTSAEKYMLKVWKNLQKFHNGEIIQ